jgi:hypothetical protein
MPRLDPFDPKNLRASDSPLKSFLAKKPPRHRKGEPFLKGPISWPWLVRAAQLPGKSLHVALLLWREAGCRKSRTVRFCLSHAEGMGMHFYTARRALRRLAIAGLVEINRQPGRGLEVTLLEVD